MAEGLQKRLQSELEKFQVVQKDYQKMVSTRQQLDGQLNENTLVKEELDLLEDSSNVYKMVGPVLVKQDKEEAKQNVQKRIDYINGEIRIKEFLCAWETYFSKRTDGTIKELDKKQDTLKESLAKIQHQLQQNQVKLAARS